MDAHFENSDPNSRFNDIVSAFLEAEDAGWAPDRRELLARYPEFADELEAFFLSDSRHCRSRLSQALPATRVCSERFAEEICRFRRAFLRTRTRNRRPGGRLCPR